MPELPDIETYRAALTARMVGATFTGVRVRGVSLLRTYDPPIDQLVGRVCTEIRRLGKRLVFVCTSPESSSEANTTEVNTTDASSADANEPWFMVLHLMIAGRLAWAAPDAPIPGKIGLAAFDLSATGAPEQPGGTLLLREAGSKKRASLHLVAGEAGLVDHDRGGLEPLTASLDDFAAELKRENRTLKRVLTDPRRFSGIGNAFSDEILHAAGLSPVKRTDSMADTEVARLYEATQHTLSTWTRTLQEQAGDAFPTDVTAFRDGFAAHGKYGHPCPACGTKVQRIRYAANETNYCPRCQTDGKVLADRSLSRLLKDDWPRTVDDLEGA